jgi:four helix bundle protein
MSNRIEEIEVYALSEVFADKVWNVVMAWVFFAKDTVGKQLVRSSDSISANIAEGFGRYHFKENKNFCYYSRGSIIETKTWLYKATSRNLIDSDTLSIITSTIRNYPFKTQYLHQIHWQRQMII